MGQETGHLAPGSFFEDTPSPSGTTALLVPCDGKSHEIATSPESDAGSGETQTISPSEGGARCPRRFNRRNRACVAT